MSALSIVRVAKILKRSGGVDFVVLDIKGLSRQLKDAFASKSIARCKQAFKVVHTDSNNTGALIAFTDFCHPSRLDAELSDVANEVGFTIYVCAGIDAETYAKHPGRAFPVVIPGVTKSNN